MAKDVTLQVRRASENNDGWCVSLNGTDVVGFFGPNARNRAEQHRDELATLLSAREALDDLRPEPQP